MKIIAWLFVILPLAWGISQTVHNSLPLFGIKPVAATAGGSSPAK